MISDTNLKKYLNVGLKAARNSAIILKKFWGKLSEIKNKKIPGDLITEADQNSEIEIINILKKNFPSHSILAEESGLHAAIEKDYIWTIDPLDGTTNYAHEFPFFAVSIALLYKGKPLVGVVYNPIMKELFYASKGKGAFLNGEKINVSKINSIEKSLLATGFSYRRKETQDNNYSEFCHLTNLTQGVRRAGCASIDLAYVASGKLDGFWENDLNPWDIAAGALLIEEAGGMVSSFDRTELNYMKPKILATNKLLHQEISDQLMLIRSRL